MHKTLLCLALAFAFRSIASATSLTAPETVEVGRLKTNEVGKFEFTVRNDSSEKIKIGGIRTSCSCTNVRIEGSETLEPGADRTITGNVNFGSKIGDYETKVLVAYESKNGESPEKIVRVQGKVAAALVFDRPRIDFGDVDLSDEPRILTVMAKRGNSEEQWDSIAATARNEHLTISAEKVTEDIIRITARLDPSGLPIASVRDTVEITILNSGVTGTEKFELPVSARITGPLKATPASIYLGAVKADEVIDRSITVTSTDLDLRELVICSQGKENQSEIGRREKNKAVVTVRLRPSSDVIGETLNLFHRTSGIRISVPVVGFVRETQQFQSDENHPRR